jgi:hypothetical protein
MSKHEKNLPLYDLPDKSQPLGMNVVGTAEVYAGSGDRVIVPGNVISSKICDAALSRPPHNPSPTLYLHIHEGFALFFLHTKC